MYVILTKYSANDVLVIRKRCHFCVLTWWRREEVVGNRARTSERRNIHRVLGDQVTMEMPAKEEATAQPAVKEATVELVRWKALTHL